MPHDYSLHVDLEIECYCCRALQPFRFASTSDQVVCSFCAHHLGESKAIRRDSDHVRLWSERYGEVRRDFDELVLTTAGEQSRADAVVAELRGTVHDLRRTVAGQFENRSVDGIRSLIENDVIRRAERNTELGERRNDRMMVVVWRIDALHHDADAGSLQCSCGTRTIDCAEWRNIEPERTVIREWERRNAALLAEGERSALPPEHPLRIGGITGTAPVTRRAGDHRGAGSSGRRKPD